MGKELRWLARHDGVKVNDVCLIGRVAEINDTKDRFFSSLVRERERERDWWLMGKF